MIFGGLFSKMTREGVRALLGRWSRDGRPRLDRKEERERGGGAARLAGEGEERGGATIAVASKLAGEARVGATELGFPIRNHRGREEAETNSFLASERPGRARWSTRPGG